MKESLNYINKNYSRYRKKMVLNNYYSKEIKKGKTVRADIVDNIILTWILFIALFIGLFRISINFFLSLYMALLGTFFLGVVLVRYKRNKRRKNIGVIREELGNKKIEKELDRLGRLEFNRYIKGVLDRYYNTDLDIVYSDMDMIGLIEGETYGVKTFKLTEDEKVGIREIDNFRRGLDLKNLSEVIIITNTSFTEEVLEDSSFILIDLDRIKEILKEIGEFPSSEEIEDYIISGYKDRKLKLKEDIKFISKGKIFKLYLLFLIFYGLSYFIKYSFYYKFMAIVCFVLATAIGGYRITEHINNR